MADLPSKEPDTVMARAVTLPITSFNPGTPRLDGKEERLKAMIANMDSHHKTIKDRINTASFAEAVTQTRPEIFAHTDPEVLATYAALQRTKEYNAHAAESKRVLVDMLKKYEGRGAVASRQSMDGGVAPRQSVDGGVAPRAVMAAPTAPMAHMAPMTSTAMEGVERTGIAPVAPMMANVTPTTSNIDASRDPRRR